MKVEFAISLLVAVYLATASCAPLDNAIDRQRRAVNGFGREIVSKARELQDAGMYFACVTFCNEVAVKIQENYLSNPAKVIAAIGGEGIILRIVERKKSGCLNLCGRKL